MQDKKGNQEVEILFPLKGNFQKALDLFNDVDYFDVHDIYYKVKPRTSLRLRDSDESYYASLTFKKDIYKGKEWLYSDEFETSACFKEMKLLLDNLFEVDVELKMTKYITDTIDYKIILEKVKGLGNFLEVEKKTKAKNIEKAKQEIRDYVKTLDINVGKELNKGKPELMKQKGDR